MFNSKSTVMEEVFNSESAGSGKPSITGTLALYGGIDRWVGRRKVWRNR